MHLQVQVGEDCVACDMGCEAGTKEVEIYMKATNVCTKKQQQSREGEEGAREVERRRKKRQKRETFTSFVRFRQIVQVDKERIASVCAIIVRPELLACLVCHKLQLVVAVW